MPIMVRRAEYDELEQVNELRKMVYEMHAAGRPGFFRPVFCDELRRYIYGKYAADDADVLVAVADETICGFAMVEYIVEPETVYSFEQRYYRVAEIGVSQDHRRQGVAMALLSYMKAEATARRLDRIELDMLEFNADALKFYEEAGFHTYRRYLELPISVE